jgi:hypothetical protein
MTLKAGIALVDPENAQLQQVIVLQYNPETLTRSLQPRTATPASDGGEKSDAMRLKGPPVETIKLDAEIDATDQLDRGDSLSSSVGIQPQLAVLEMMVYPTVTQLQQVNALAQAGTLEITPMQASLALFIWSKNRIIPVRITDFSITEEAFDSALNPIRAKVSIGLRVLSVDDLGFDQKGGSLYLAYQQKKESLAQMYTSGGLASLGIGGIG